MVWEEALVKNLSVNETFDKQALDLNDSQGIYSFGQERYVASTEETG